jgi:plastocyanin
MMLRKMLVTAIAAFSLVAVSSASASTVAISITTNGYVPNAATISGGDTVQFTNSDTVAHQVSFKSMTGVSCAPSGLVLQPTQAGSCTFATAGSFMYDDPNVKGNTLRGTVTVNAPVVAKTITLVARSQFAIYGGKLTFTGTLSSQKLGQNVDVLETQCGQTAASKATTVQTTAGGAYTALVQPLRNTVYHSKATSTTSSDITVKVQPRLRFGKLAAHRYSLRVSAAQSFSGKYGTLQRYNTARSRWVNVKTVQLRATSTGIAPTVISSASFRATVRVHSKIRMILAQTQAGPCYQRGTSNVIGS